MTAAPDAFHYRCAQPRDVPALLALWEEATGWGVLTAEQWRSWYEEAPYGPAIVCVAEDGCGGLKGQIVLTPCPMWIDGKESLGVRVSAPIIHPDVRQYDAGDDDFIRHPTVELYRTGIAAARERGAATVHSLPDRRWIRSMDWLASVVSFAPRQRGWHSCVGVPLASVARRAKPERVAVVTSFGTEFDRLWTKGRSAFPVRALVRRSPAWLGYKNGGHLTLEIRAAGGSLAGYAALDIAKRSLVDYFATDPDGLVDVLGATVAWLAASARDSGRLAEVATVSALAVPATAAALAATGFMPVKFELGFFADALDSRVDIGALAPNEWFLTSGD